jgi:hypothetical protein
MRIISEVKSQKSHIQTDSYTMSLSELLNRWKDGDISISPDYQRLFRWSIEQQTRLIESILLDLPIPPIFLAQNDDEKFEVIDGLQRVSTLVKFFSPYLIGENALSGIDNASEEEDEDGDSEKNRSWNINLASKLEGAQELPSLNGYHYKILPESLITAIRNYRIWFIFLKKESSKHARYQLFKRLNTYGTPLSSQEIRNCTSRLLGQRFPTKLREIANNSEINKAMGFTKGRANAQYVEELLLRLLAFCFDRNSAVHNVSEFLDGFMEKASEEKISIDDTAFFRLISVFSLISQIFPEGEAFRFRKNNSPVGAFSTNLFDIIGCGIFLNFDYLNRLNIQEVKIKIDEIYVNSEIKNLIGAGSNTRKKMIGRVEFGMKWFAQ